MENKNLHTVILDPDKCKGCVTCMKRCPTEAIRVRNGKASVLYERCIGCGECVRLCPHQAKLANYDPFDITNNYKYKIAIPAPSFYGQFNNLEDINLVLNALLEIGFDDVFEVGRGAELVSQVTKMLFDKGELKKPVISTACPAVLELICVKYKNLMPNLLNLLSPVEVTAKLAREKAEKEGVPKQDIGVFFISPCPAKMFYLKNGLATDNPVVDGVLGVSDIYMKVVSAMKNIKNVKKISKIGAEGICWASSGGESAGVSRDKYLAADGIENVIDVLNSLESSNLSNVEFIELNACTSGCVGGVLNIENPFIAKARLREIQKKLPKQQNFVDETKKDLKFYTWDKTPNYEDFYCVSDDRNEAMKKLIETEKILETLPLIDCGLCGAPSCRAFAEDIVSGRIPKDSKCPRIEIDKHNEH